MRKELQRRRFIVTEGPTEDKEYLYISHTVEHNYISPSGTVVNPQVAKPTKDSISRWNSEGSAHNTQPAIL